MGAEKHLFAFPLSFLHYQFQTLTKDDALFLHMIRLRLFAEEVILNSFDDPIV